MIVRAVELLGLLTFAAALVWLVLDHGLDWLMRRVMTAGGIHLP